MFFRLLVLAAWLVTQGAIVFAVETTTIQITPDKGFYRPGEMAQFHIQTTGGVRYKAQVMYLLTPVATLMGSLTDGSAELTWTPPPDVPRGYGLIVEVFDEAGTLVSAQTSAFDVLNHWMDAPRYGFFSDFTAARSEENYAQTADWLLRHHINGIQFYDWQYRWEDLIPETDTFDDGLGRPQSMVTVRRLIDLIRPRNIAAMPYTAIYGASAAFGASHPEWALYNALHEAYNFGDNLITIMDPTPGSLWNQHLLGEFADVLDNMVFDGIHIDQYGSPKNGFDNAGNPVDMTAVFPQFVNQTAELVQEKRGDDGVVLMNAVGNYPIETLAPSQQDASYIEVWSPNNDYLDLNRIVTNAEYWGDGKPVIIAAYIPPAQTLNWQIANSVILSSGGTHLETGEPGTMLAHAYFPWFGRLTPEQEASFLRYYDFQVRYENVLSTGTTAGTYERHNTVDLGDVRTRGIRSRNRVVPIARAGENFETVSLINFMGIDNTDWNVETTVAPTPFTDLAVALPVERSVAQVWFASPDSAETMNGAAIPFLVEDGTLRFTLPTLSMWTMIVVEYADVR